jgi:hypothetical protein
MKEVLKLALTTVWLAIPVFVVGWRNSFRSRWATAARALAALLVSWMWLAGEALAITKIDLAFAASVGEETAIAGGDGARHVFALLFGWLPSAVLVALTWAGFHLNRVLRHNRARARAS